ncbi:hypothetical protein NQ317_019091 [Molorchus minor]|uniref:Uncharacterized protein n=1 Tax=Molorchus minor TaxID=1323400 RepID=A0ABQ9JKF0_9CUCU|nr:hypothetical protein NQ317_019091 [Molorchus minor]
MVVLSSSGRGSIQLLFFPEGCESTSCSLWSIFCSRLSLAKADCIMAAWASDPSGLPCRNGGSSSTNSISISASAPSSSLGSKPVSSSNSGNSLLSIQPDAIICFISHLSGLDILVTLFLESSSPSSTPTGSLSTDVLFVIGLSGFRSLSSLSCGGVRQGVQILTGHLADIFHREGYLLASYRQHFNLKNMQEKLLHLHLCGKLHQSEL